MKRLLWMLALAVAPAAAAQQEGPAPEDSAQVERLRAEIERRFGERVRLELGLNDDQAAKLKGTQGRFGTRRRDLLRQQFLHRQALQQQMRPGIAANPESVRVHMDGLQAGRAELFQLEQDEDREMSGYLSPIQRAQFQMLRQRFIERVNQMRWQRQQMRRPGMQRPGGRRPRRRP